MQFDGSRWDEEYESGRTKRGGPEKLQQAVRQQIGPLNVNACPEV